MQQNNNQLAIIYKFDYIYEYFFFQEMYKKYKREQKITNYLQELLDLQLEKELI